MGKRIDAAKERIEVARQHHHAERLRAESIKEYADDPDVVFHAEAAEPHDAEHGVNTPDEMEPDGTEPSDP